MVKEAIEKIREEIKDDRYKGKSPKEIADFLNAPVIVTETKQVTLSNRRSQIISQLLMNEGTVTNDTLKKAIIEEITNDPLKLGYKARSNGQVNNDILDEITTGKIEMITQHPPRIYQILIGIVGAPNFVTENDIIEIFKEVN